MTEIKNINECSRNAYFDFLRGIAIIMVVAIHSFGEIYRYGSLSFFALFLRQLMNVAVPIFCVSSAYFLIDKICTGKSYFTFLKKHIVRVYIPLLFFSLPYFFQDLVAGKNVVKSLLKMITCAYSVYYFIALIIQFYFLLPLFQRYKLFKNKLIGFAISFMWVFIYCYFVRKTVELPSIIYGGFIVCFWTYFSIGASVSKDIKLEKKLFFIVITLIALFASVSESYFIMAESLSLVGSGLKPSAVLFSSAFVLLLYSLDFQQIYRQTQFTKIFEKLGRFSLGIYLGHLFVQSSLIRFTPPPYKI